MGYSAETAVAGATISQDQEGSGPARKTLPQIRAAGFLTDGINLVPLEDPMDVLVGGSSRDPPLQPGGFDHMRPSFMTRAQIASPPNAWSLVGSRR